MESLYPYLPHIGAGLVGLISLFQAFLAIAALKQARKARAGHATIRKSLRTQNSKVEALENAIDDKDYQITKMESIRIASDRYWRHALKSQHASYAILSDENQLLGNELAGVLAEVPANPYETMALRHDLSDAQRALRTSKNLKDEADESIDSLLSVLENRDMVIRNLKTKLESEVKHGQGMVETVKENAKTIEALEERNANQAASLMSQSDWYGPSMISELWKPRLGESWIWPPKVTC